jgi:biotin-dependent carboxylase-like uncharacterized protein
MQPALRVLAPGLLTTVQDLGRVGHQYLGVSVSGALDPISLRAANALVGNAAQEGALEVAYAGPTLVVEADSVRIGIAGAAAPVELFANETASNATRLETGRSIRLERGNVLRIGTLSEAAVLYIAVEGGLAIEPMLGSVSTYVRAGIGGWHGRALVSEDLIPLRRSSASDRAEVRFNGWTATRPRRVRAIVGPQADYFSEHAIRTLFTSSYRIAADSDRMGMRLTGAKVEHSRGFDIVSDGVAPGSIQVPGNGQPIVLMADRQTTGGYPKIATVISADLPALGRLRIGDTISFEEVSLETAQALRRKLLDEVDDICEHIVPIARTEGEITKSLIEANLISGAVDACGW